MSDLELIQELASLGVRLWVDGDALKFSAPRGVLTGHLLERLRARKEAIRAFLVRAKRSPHAGAPTLSRVGREGPLSLSFAQERLWFLHLLDPADPSYAVPLVVRFEGALDTAALERALQALMRRHEALRTTFALSEGQAVATVHEDAELPLPSSSVTALPEGDREAAVRREIAAEIQRPFDLGQGPVIRARLFELAPHDHVLVLNAHHIVTDGWSNDLLRREIEGLYSAFVAGLPSPLPDLAIQYVDYAAWQRRWLTDEVLADEVAYWTRHLADAPRVLDLPYDRPRPDRATHAGGVVRFAIDGATSRGVERLAGETGATPFMVLLATFAVLLARCSDQADLCVGTPVAGRSRPETEGIVGFFVNTLVLRIRVRAGESVRALLADVRDECLSAFAHQDLPFERLVRELDPERAPGRTPLFQVMFSMRPSSAPARAPEAGRPVVSPRGIAVPLSTAKFDLSLALGEAADGYSGGMEFASDVFDRATVERMAASFVRLLRAAVAEPNSIVGELPLLDEVERRRVVEEWSATRGEHPREATVHALFAAQAASSPDAVAVELGAESWSYRVLDTEANRLAHLLRARGVGLETPVGLYALRSWPMVVATVAILKAGGAYVPLSPELPDARLAWMVRDAGVALVVAAGISAADRALGAPVLDLAVEGPTLRGQPDHAPDHAGSATSLVYVMYTSGSTGTPKGVGVVHRGVVRLVEGAGFARLDAGETFLQLAPIGFDAATLELWAPLLHGARLVLYPPDKPTPERLGEVIRDHGVTTLWLTAGLFNLVLDERPEALRPLRQLLAGGEALSVPHVRKALAALPDVRLVNGYGPTEGTTFTSCHTVTSAEGADSIPIGRPIAGTLVYVLDPRRAPVPVGVPGELYVGGDGLARGYLGRPDLTAERFVPDPLASKPGARLYRTGDRVRWLPDGTLAFLGRLDAQVKLRGFRIEPGEIEATLLLHPAVRACTVFVREDDPGDRRLVGYVVADPAPAAAELRAFLAQRLPDFMVPSALVTLDALPLTANGKVDRRALPPPSTVLAAPSEPVVPRGPIEQTLAEIFADVLGLPPGRVGAHDHFFELGGHSLLATRVVARVRSALGAELPLRAIFDTPRLADLAALVEDTLRAGRALALPPLVAAQRSGPAPLSFAQERLWFLHQLDPKDPSYVVPLISRFDGPLDSDALARALAEIQRRHEILRTTFELPEGHEQPRALVHPELTLDLDPTSLEALPDTERADALRRALADELATPFDLARGPLLRARLFALAPEEHVLVLTMHHIVSDAWTLGVLQRELGALYDAFSQARPSPLAPLPLQYADYALWQRAWLQGDHLQRQLDHWKHALAGAPPTLDLPTDRPRPPRPSHRGARAPFALGPQASNDLRRLAAREGVTLFMTLLAAFDVLLHRWSGQSDILVGTPIANRTHAETDNLVGFFVNTLVLRARIDPDAPFRHLLHQVRETALDAYAHQDTPFERLVQELDPQRDPARSPLFQVMFALQNADSGQLSLARTRRKSLHSEGATAKFDLNLALADSNNGIHGALEFATDLFDPHTIDRLLRSFRSLLGGIAAHPDWPTWRLPVLDETEIQRLERSARETEFAHPLDRFIHEVVAAQAAQTPDAPAIVFEGNRLSYGNFAGRVARLADALRRRGVAPDVLVGVHLHRSVEMVVAVHAALAAGGAYVPLDPDLPPERLAFMLEDSRPRVIITARELAARLPSHAADSLHVDAPEGTGAPTGATRPVLESLAYVIYTSGSTGRPKGAMNAHGAILNRLAWMQHAFSIGADDRVLQKTPFSFDVSVWELFWPLMYGASLVLARPEGHRDPAYLADLIAAERITTVHFVPSMLEVFLEALAQAPGARRSFPSLRRVLISGEALPPTVAQRFFTLLPGVELHNLYGPTEAAVDVTWWRARAGAGIVPIGRPVHNTRIHILDDRLQRVPDGVRGEIYIGGAQVGRGYLSRPGLTAERFVPDPFAEAAPGSRMYRSGDAGRRLGSGDIEFLGRLDHQVKIRGFRIELGEIEVVLLGHPEVREVVVVARALQDDASTGSPAVKSGDQRLVAYAVTRGAVTAATLRTFLRAALPEHMVPSEFVMLDALPLTPSGKIDRRALPSPRSSAAPTFAILPRDSIEEALADIFAELLGRDHVGPHDDFFELGGHSLRAAQAVARIRGALGVDLPLRALFESPTVAGLTPLVSVALGRDGDPSYQPIPRAPRGAPMEASFGQERLWVLHQIAPTDPSYVVPLTRRISGSLDAGALERALVEIVRRHEVLRTTFSVIRGRPMQILHEDPAWRLSVQDLRDLPPPEREAAARDAARSEGRRPFDLARGPVIRAKLLVLTEEDHLLLLSLHHIACDAWSIGVLSRELDLLYDAYHAGRPSPLPDLPIQYADFTAWQRGFIAGERLERHLAYWKEALAGAAREIDLPTDRPRPRVPTRRGAWRAFALSADTGAGISTLARREGATLFMTLLAAFQALLFRHTGQDDISIGTPVQNRTHTETEGLIGFFLNTVVLRARMSPDLSFRAHLRHVKETCLGAYAHQDLPFERLVTELDPERDLARSPLFQVLFTFRDAPASATPSSPHLGGKEGVAEMAAAKFDLSLGMERRPGGALGGAFEYALDLFDASTIDRLAARFHLLLESIARDPERSLGELPLLPEEERRRIVVEWNDTAFSHPEHSLIHEIIADQARRTPAAVAVSFEGRDLRYGELDTRAEHLSRSLRRLGVGPDTLVGVCMERSIELVVALYAVLKAGGAYVPLDPEHPRERLAFMLDDAAPRVILTQDRLADALPKHGAEVMRVDIDAPPVGAEPAVRIERAGLLPESLAYVIYTSGSTGRPKGAMNTHRGILNRLLWMQHAFPLGPDDRVLQKTPFSFDVSVWELFWPLMFGARLVVARPGGHRDPLYLIDTVAGAAITVMHFVPSLLGPFLDQPGADRCRTLRRVIASGEALPPALVDRFFAKLPGVSLHNLYGPTEAAIDVTAWECRPGASVIPIGKPVHNTRIYILDDQRRVVPQGVRGELYIAGVQVGRGYLNRPELTAERFVDDPFAPGARMYRTGDVARWLPSGDIEYLGRADFQVKLRGFRIELGEIEATLTSHPGVREAVVVLRRPPGPGAERLVAYLVSAPGAPPPTVGELRAFLGERLPEHMIPAVFVLLPALPLTPSGKTDRRALPEPDDDNRAEAEEAFVSPEGFAEEELARIWAAVLRSNRVGARDNFFAAGGDSILALEVVSRAQAAGIHITPRQIFQYPTIAELASVAGAAPSIDAEQGPVTGAVPATPILAWWLDQRAADAHHDNQAFLFEVRARLDGAVLGEAIDCLVEHHDMLRLRVTGDGHDTGAFVLSADRGPHALWQVALAALPEGERRGTLEGVATEAQASLDLRAGPVLRAVLFDLGPDRTARLLLVIHHLAVDGVSWRVLLDDLWSAYSQRLAGTPVTLPPKTTSFKRWAERLAEHARSESVAAERDYWRRVASARVSPLPVDRDHGPDDEASARSVSVSLSETDTEALLTRVPDAYRTQVNDALLTALALALASWTEEATPGGAPPRTRIAHIDLEGHGREGLFEDVDLTRTVGWFTVIFPVVLEVDASAGPGEALRAVKEQLRSIPGRGIGHGLLRWMGPDRTSREELGAAPRAQISFNYLGQMDRTIPEDAPLRPAKESPGPSRSPRAARRHLLEVAASVHGGRLAARWTYSENRHDRATVEAVAERWLDALRGLIDHCLSPGAGGITPSDFHRTEISQDALDVLAALDPEADAGDG